MIDKNNELHFLEINFRNSTWSYASTRVGMNLVTGWAIAVLEKEEHVPVSKEIPAGYTAMVELSDIMKKRTFSLVCLRTLAAASRIAVPSLLPHLESVLPRAYFGLNDFSR